MSRHLGVNKDLEPFARKVRRAGGSVEVTRSNHVRWEMVDGTTLRSGLTMSGRSAHNDRRAIERALAALSR